MYKSIAMGGQYGFGLLSVSRWFVRIYFFKFGAINFFNSSYVIEIKPDQVVTR